MKREQFIPELNQTLSDWRLDVWLGKDENDEPVKRSKHDCEVKKAAWRRLAARGVKIETPAQEWLRKPCGCNKPSS